MSTPAAATLEVSEVVHQLMTEGMKKVKDELNHQFDVVPTWDRGHRWRSLPGNRREWAPDHLSPCGSQPRGKRSEVVHRMHRIFKRSSSDQLPKARPTLHPSPFTSWFGPWVKADYKQWKSMTKAQQRAWAQKLSDHKAEQAKEEGSLGPGQRLGQGQVWRGVGEGCYTDAEVRVAMHDMPLQIRAGPFARPGWPHHLRWGAWLKKKCFVGQGQDLQDHEGGGELGLKKW